MSWVEATSRGVVIKVRLQPRASRSRIIGVFDDALKVAVTAPPVEGEANRQCLRMLAKTLKVPVSDLELISGEKSHRKKIEIQSLSLPEITNRLL